MNFDLFILAVFALLTLLACVRALARAWIDVARAHASTHAERTERRPDAISDIFAEAYRGERED